MPLSVNNRMKNGALGVRILKSAPSGKVQYVAVPVKSIPKPVRWSFLFFVFTIPFEAQDLGVLSGSLSLARISGLLFLTVYFLYHIPFFAQRHFPPMLTAIRWFLGYIAVYTLSGIFVPAELFGDFVVRLITLGQLFVFLWIASDLLKDNRFATSVLLTYSVAVAILALGIIFNVTGLSHEVTAGRTTAGKEDLNQLATHMGIAVIIFIGLYFSSAFKRFWGKLMVAALMLLPLVAIVNTGSRGGLAAFMAGLFVFLAPYGRMRWRLAPAFMGILIMASAAYMVASNPDFLERWYQSYYDRDFAQRENIFPAAIEMILERPLLGWQSATWYELAFRLGEWQGGDPHNLLLHVLLEVGVVGTIPFLVGLWLCGRCAWRARWGNLGFLPLSLFTTVLVASMSLTTVVWKPFWLILAVTVGSAEGMLEWKKRSGTLRVRRLLRISGGAKLPSFTS